VPTTAASGGGPTASVFVSFVLSVCHVVRGLRG
jgi:hypothetical protein